MTAKVLGCIAAIAFALSANAQELDCEDALSQQHMNKCAGIEYEREAEQLRVTVAAFSEMLEPATRVKFEKAQQHWQDFSDAHCQFIGSAEAEGGSMMPMVIGFCLASAAEERRLFLEGFDVGEPDL